MLTDPNSAQHSNIFQVYFTRMHRDSDFSFMLEGLVRLLSNPVQSNNTYLPGSRKRIRFSSELVLFVWRLVDLNKRFMSFLLQDSRLMDLVMPILACAIEAGEDDSQVGLVHVVAFLLLILSGERNFGVRLNRPFTKHFPGFPRAEASNADVLIFAIHKLIVHGKKVLFQLYECLLTIIANAAPFVKSMSSSSAQKLISLLRSFTSPRLLYDAPNNFNLSVILLDAINSFVQYQFDGNTRLVYAILRNAELFGNLNDISLESALAKLSLGGDSAPSTPRPPRAEDKAAAAAAAAAAATAETATSTTATAAASGERALPDVKIAQGTFDVYGFQSLIALPIEPNEHHRKHLHSGRFTPTEEWISVYKRRMNLSSILRLIQILVPQIEQLCVEQYAHGPCPNRSH